MFAAEKSDEEVLTESLPSGTTYWPLLDHLNTACDLVDSDGENVLHRTCDAFGILTQHDGIDFLFAFTGRPYDSAIEFAV